MHIKLLLLVILRHQNALLHAEMPPIGQCIVHNQIILGFPALQGISSATQIKQILELSRNNMVNKVIITIYNLFNLTD